MKAMNEEGVGGRGQVVRSLLLRWHDIRSRWLSISLGTRLQVSPESNA